jgi:glutamate-1-semialdehyde 2,1-aminomutase
MWDVDGNEYIDYVNNMGPLILGHKNPRVLSAVKEQMDHAFLEGGPSELELELAEKITELYPCAEHVQFYPSGTEACMNAIRVLRAHTGKEKIAMFEGGYHGSSDSVFDTKGVPKDLLNKLIYIPYNDTEAAERIIRENRKDLAMVFAEAVLKDIVPKDGFLKALREFTQENDVPLAFDEVVTGFRLAAGGVQARFGVVPDLVVLGKIIGGGFPCGGVASSREIMSQYSFKNGTEMEAKKPNVEHPGTFNDHKITMAAGLATIKELTPQAYDHLDKIGMDLRSGLKGICADLGIKAQITGMGSIFHIYFTDREVIDAKSAKSADPLLIRYFDLAMLVEGVNLPKAHCSYCSVPMTDSDVKLTLQAMEKTLSKIKPMIKASS